jgi:hypothetical protein
MGRHQLLEIGQHWYKRDLMPPPHCLKSQYQHQGLAVAGTWQYLFREPIPRRFAFVLRHKELFIDAMKPKNNIKLHTIWGVFASKLIINLDRKRYQN